MRALTAARSLDVNAMWSMTPVRGFGIGRRLGEDIRVSFDVNYVQRRTNVARSNYEGFRFGGSISYGTP